MVEDANPQISPLKVFPCPLLLLGEIEGLKTSTGKECARPPSFRWSSCFMAADPSVFELSIDGRRICGTPLLTKGGVERRRFCDCRFVAF
ncbi:hypothetical protein CDAR_608481 [Caerostris darwini]|uniref:Uncharacterized protein n=1 Tax=Caerostris darwini TaxID=1538125 RepID=A0AAV4WKJ8_9ARAC|nr:hypothetical protein CDAR_608481 [Caerostris darwini]